MTSVSMRRYLRKSELCEKVAQALNQLTYEEERELFDFGQRGSEPAPVILLVDRKEDPVTPLLTQWTYQAMVHELLGIHANRIDLPPSANVCRPSFSRTSLPGKDVSTPIVLLFAQSYNYVRSKCVSSRDL